MPPPQLQLLPHSVFFSRQRLSSDLRRIVKNRYLNLLVGLTLIAMSANEVWESLADGFDLTDLNSHAGLALIGFLHILKALPDLLEGLEHLEEKETGS